MGSIFTGTKLEPVKATLPTLGDGTKPAEFTCNWWLAEWCTIQIGNETANVKVHQLLKLAEMFHGGIQKVRNAYQQ